MSEKEHPCGSVPVDSWSVSVYYCQAHDVWWGYSVAYTQDGDERMQTHRNVSTQFGPFDTSTDVRAWAKLEAAAIDHMAKRAASRRSG